MSELLHLKAIVWSRFNFDNIGALDLRQELPEIELPEILITTKALQMMNVNVSPWSIHPDCIFYAAGRTFSTLTGLHLLGSLELCVPHTEKRTYASVLLERLLDVLRNSLTKGDAPAQTLSWDQSVVLRQTLLFVATCDSTYKSDIEAVLSLE